MNQDLPDEPPTVRPDDRPDDVRPDQDLDQPQARLRAAPEDQRTGPDSADLLKVGDEQTRQWDEAVSAGAEDGGPDPAEQPETLLEALPEDRREGHGPEDLLRDSPAL